MDVVPGIMGRQSPEAVLSQKLRAVVLLAGSVRQGRLGSMIGRPVFDLPLGNGYSIMDDWRRESEVLAGMVAGGRLSVRVMIDRATSQPPLARASLPGDAVQIQIERDPLEYRGTGGVLRDVGAVYAEDDYLLVANAAQVLMEPLADLAVALSAICGDVAIVSHRDGTPSGMFLVRCGVLRELPETGFVDMKEQALPAIAAHHQVAVIERDRPSAMPVLSLRDYVTAVRCHQQRMAGATIPDGPFAEDWECAFSIVEPGANVHASARLHDSVVLCDGCVEADTVLAHSVVCPGGVLRRGQMAIDALIAPGGNVRQRE